MQYYDLTTDQVHDICLWLYKYGFDPKRVVYEFSDAAPLARLLRKLQPKLIDPPHLTPRSSESLKQANWEILRIRLLEPKLKIKLSQQDMKNLSMRRSQCVLSLLWSVKLWSDNCSHTTAANAQPDEASVPAAAEIAGAAAVAAPAAVPAPAPAPAPAPVPAPAPDPVPRNTPAVVDEVEQEYYYKICGNKLEYLEFLRDQLKRKKDELEDLLRQERNMERTLLAKDRTVGELHLVLVRAEVERVQMAEQLEMRNAGQHHTDALARLYEDRVNREHELHELELLYAQAEDEDELVHE